MWPNPQETANLVTFTNCGFGHIYWKNLLWKTSFFVQRRFTYYTYVTSLSKSPSAFLFSVLTLGLKASAFSCPKSTIEKPEQCVNSFQSQQQRHQNDVRDIVLVSLFLTLNRFHRLFLCFNLWIWASKCRLGRE